MKKKKLRLRDDRMKFRRTKQGLPICPFILVKTKDGEVRLTFCNHEDNPDPLEGNCQKKNCPLIK